MKTASVRPAILRATTASPRPTTPGCAARVSRFCRSSSGLSGIPVCAGSPARRFCSTTRARPRGVPVRYIAPTSGARVFSAGSLQFAWGLDDWAPPTRGFVYPAIPGLQQFMRNALDDLARPAPQRVEARAAGAPERGAARDTDRRQSARGGRFPRRPGRVQNTWRCLRGGRALDRTYGYLAVAVDEWGRESGAAFISAAVPNTPPALRLVHARRSFHAVASDADGDRLVYRWRVDGRRWPTSRSTIKPRLDNGRHVVEVTVTDGGGRATKRLRLGAS